MSETGSDDPDGVVSATSLGWMRRKDVGPSVWEMPDGSLYVHLDVGEPMFHRVTRELLPPERG